MSKIKAKPALELNFQHLNIPLPTTGKKFRSFFCKGKTKVGKCLQTDQPLNTLEERGPTLKLEKMLKMRKSFEVIFHFLIRLP